MHLSLHMLWPMNCIPRLCLGCLSPPCQNKTMDAKPGLGGCSVGASNMDTKLGFLYLCGYKTWLQNLVQLSLDTTPKTPALVEQFYFDVLLVGACMSLCVGAHMRLYVRIGFGSPLIFVLVRSLFRPHANAGPSLSFPHQLGK